VTSVYDVEAVIEQWHWWFVGRRRLFAAELARAGVPKTARVLDVGTGTGANLRMLQDLGYARVVGLDVNDEVIRFCETKGLGHVRRGDVCAIPFGDESFELVLVTDVIEHVDSDARALAEIARVLAPGGRALITVPAFQSLWGLQDEVAEHKRRYRLGTLVRRVTDAGLAPRRRFYFNYLLCGPIWLARQVIRLAGVRLASEGQVNTPILNALLSRVFAVDVVTAPWLRPPFGVSIFLMAFKPPAGDARSR
jgi:SAM-dependent methyltransferase